MHWPPDAINSLAEAWLILVGLRGGWVVAVLLGLRALRKDSPHRRGLALSRRALPKPYGEVMTDDKML